LSPTCKLDFKNRDIGERAEPTGWQPESWDRERKGVEIRVELEKFLNPSPLSI
jgi:hypothetical protein